MKPKIVLLASEGDSTSAVYNALAKEFGAVKAVFEGRESKATFLRRRIKRLGIRVVAGQLGFTAIRMLGDRRARSRIAEICREHNLNLAPVTTPDVRVDSVNSPEARAVLQSLRPDVVVVNGTRIISATTLGALSCPVINMHAGITPAYRGVHGGYWALVEGRPDLVGTTIHLVDAGIDTGNIIAQAFFHVKPTDSFSTYPYLHVAAGIPVLIRAVRDAIEGRLRVQAAPSTLPSVLRYHPTAWEYVRNRLTNGVR